MKKKKEVSEPKCLDCNKILNPQRAEVFEVCLDCFEERIKKWLAKPPSERGLT